MSIIRGNPLKSVMDLGTREVFSTSVILNHRLGVSVYG